MNSRVAEIMTNAELRELSCDAQSWRQLCKEIVKGTHSVMKTAELDQLRKDAASWRAYQESTWGHYGKMPPVPHKAITAGSLQPRGGRIYVGLCL